MTKLLLDYGTELDKAESFDHGLDILELEFLEEGQGCVTLSYIGCEGPLKAYLYRQEKSRLLKLVGQARERSKSHLFFECNFTEGRYFLFAQAQESPARLAYLGEGRPTLKITEEIHSEGLKNDVAEYHGRHVDFAPLWSWPKPMSASRSS